MSDFYSLSERISPSGIYPFVDKAQVWLTQALTRPELRSLKGHCGLGGLHIKNEPAWFDRSLIQRLQLNQPTREALQSLSIVGGVFLNYAELCLDWVFDDETKRREAFAFCYQYHVKKNHRGQGIRWVGGTRYTGPRKAPNVLAVYPDRPSKVTGEIYCVHFDWRIKGAVALRRAGITRVSDLIKLDHRQFWKERLLMCNFNLHDLGRMYHVHVAGKGRRREPWIICSGRRGSVITLI